MGKKQKWGTGALIVIFVAGEFVHGELSTAPHIQEAAETTESRNQGMTLGNSATVVGTLYGLSGFIMPGGVTYSSTY